MQQINQDFDDKFFIDREAELEQMQSCLSAAIHRCSPRFVLVRGEFGMGKTVLVQEFLRLSSLGARDLLVAQGRCSLETAGNGLVPWSQVLKQLEEQYSGGHNGTGASWGVIRAVAPAWLNYLTGGLAEPVIDSLREITKPNWVPEEHVFTQFANALAQFAERAPIAIFIDDLHWADESSLRLLFHLHRNLANVPILIICTYRPEIALETNPAGRVFSEIRANLIRDFATEIKLTQGIDTHRYVARRYPQNQFGPELIERIQATTGGNPLFLEQLFVLWEKTDVIYLSTHEGLPSWEMKSTAEASIPIPPALTEVMKQRLALVENDLRKTLICAAVEGEHFVAQVIARLRQIDDFSLFGELAELDEQHHMVHEEKTQDVGALHLDIYHFEQRFLQEYVYSKLPTGQRRLLHRQIAQHLEALHEGSDMRPIAAQLAWHYGESDESLKGATYALMAANYEQERFSWASSATWCRYGLQLLDPGSIDPQVLGIRLDLLETSARRCFWTGQYAQGQEQYEAAMALAQSSKIGAERIANLYGHLADLLEAEGKYYEAVTQIERGLGVLTEAATPIGEAYIQLRWLQGLMYSRFGEPANGVDCLLSLLHDAETLPRTHAVRRLFARVTNSLGITLIELGQHNEALQALLRAMAYAEELHDDVILPSILSGQITVHLLTRDLGQARRCAEKAGQLAKRSGDSDTAMFVLGQEAEISLLEDQPQNAQDKLLEAIRLAETAGALWYLSHLHAMLALACLALKNVAEANRLAQLSVAEAQKEGYQFEIGVALDALAQVEVASGDLATATTHFRDAIAIHTAAGHRANTAIVQRHLAQMLIDQGCQNEATELLASSLATFSELDLGAETEITERILRHVEEPVIR